jgi:hypothetical protein
LQQRQTTAIVITGIMAQPKLVLVRPLVSDAVSRLVAPFYLS